MHPVNFPGAVEIKKPDNMTDEQCISVWAKFGFDALYKIFEKQGSLYLPPAIIVGVDTENFPYYMTAWQPNREDITAALAGRPICIKTLCKALPPMAVFTLDDNGNGNF